MDRVYASKRMRLLLTRAAARMKHIKIAGAMLTWYDFVTAQKHIRILAARVFGTVTVVSENLQVLLLGKTVFEELVESGVIANSVFKHAKDLANARTNISYSRVLQKTELFRW